MSRRDGSGDYRSTEGQIETSDWPWFTGTHRKGRSGTILYEELLKGHSTRSGFKRRRNATEPERAAIIAQQRKCQRGTETEQCWRAVVLTAGSGCQNVIEEPTTFPVKEETNHDYGSQ
jgi:hypothetical protein